MDNFDLKKYLSKNILLENEFSPTKIVELYEVYYETFLDDEEDLNGCVGFKDEETFNSPAGDFIRDNYQITDKGYANVSLSQKEIDTLETKGFIDLR